MLLPETLLQLKEVSLPLILSMLHQVDRFGIGVLQKEVKKEWRVDVNCEVRRPFPEFVHQTHFLDKPPPVFPTIPE